MVNAMNKHFKTTTISLLLINILLHFTIVFARDYYVDFTGKGRPPSIDTKDGYFARYPNMSVIADYPSFRILYQAYGSDKNHVYYQGDIIKDANPQKFHVLQGNLNRDQGYAKDDERVYSRGKLIAEADAPSFELIERIKPRGEYSEYVYAKDQNNIYINTLKIANSDPSSFYVALNGMGFDKNQVYYRDRALKGSDPGSFKMINEDFFKDKNHLYYRSSRIDGADSQSFTLLIDNFFSKLIKDNKHVYSFKDDHWETLSDIDAHSFERVEGTDFFQDKNAFYSWQGDFLVEKAEGQKIRSQKINTQNYLNVDGICYSNYASHRSLSCEE